MNPKEWISVPVLPCVALGDTLGFWENLGYAVTYRQDKPYAYGVVERGGYQLHFARIKGLDPGSAYHGCLVMVSDVVQVHAAFCERLKLQLGRVPVAGLPRISRMKPGQTRFTLTDVSGNSIIFIRFGQEDQDNYEKAEQAGLSPLQKNGRGSLTVKGLQRRLSGCCQNTGQCLETGNRRRGSRYCRSIGYAYKPGNGAREEDKAAACRIRLAQLKITEATLDALRVRHGRDN